MDFGATQWGPRYVVEFNPGVRALEAHLPTPAIGQPTNPREFKPEAVSDPSQAKARGGDIAWGAQLATDLHPTPHTHGRPLRCEVRVVHVMCMGKRKRVARSVGTWMDSADLRTEKEQRKQWREWQWRMCET